MAGQFQSLGLELFRRINTAQYLVQQLVGCLNLANYLVAFNSQLSQFYATNAETFII